MPKPTIPSISNSGSVDLEIKDAQVIFKTVWSDLEEEVGHENLRFPKELILLGGAPGSGKGTHTQFITDARGLTCPPIVGCESYSNLNFAMERYWMGSPAHVFRWSV